MVRLYSEMMESELWPSFLMCAGEEEEGGWCSRSSLVAGGGDMVYGGT